MTQRPAIVKIALALLCLLLFGSLASCLTQNPVLGAIALLCLAAVLVAMGRGNCWAALGLAAYLGADAAGLWFLPYARTAGTGEAAITSGGLAILAAVFVFAGFALRKAQPDKTWTAWPWFLPVPAIGAFLLVFQVFVIPTGSMEPTLLTGDFIAVRKSGSAGITRGSIAVYRRGNSTTIKRVIGLPGDRIRIEHKKLFVNGIAAVEPFVKHATDYEESFRDNFPSTPNTHLLGKAEQQLQTQVRGGEFIVPAGDFFALGDNPDLSLDSRYEGTYPLQAIIGQPVFLYFSAEPPADREQMRIVLSHTRWNRIFLAPR